MNEQEEYTTAPPVEFDQSPLPFCLGFSARYYRALTSNRSGKTPTSVSDRRWSGIDEPRAVLSGARGIPRHALSARDDGALEAAYIRLRKGKSGQTQENIVDTFLADHDDRGDLPGIEILALVKLAELASLVEERRRPTFRKFLETAAPSGANPRLMAAYEGDEFDRQMPRPIDLHPASARA